MTKKKAKKRQLIFELPDGTQYLVTGEDGVFWYCRGEQGDTQFRKAANRGIVKEAEEEPPAEAESEGEE